MSTLPAEVALVVEGLGKRNTDVHELRYMPAVSLVSSLRSRRERLPTGLAVGLEDDEEDEEDEEETELELELAGNWALQDVSFAVAPGEALGLVGDRTSVMSLMRILVGMTAPTAGRFAYRGRAGLTSEMALTLARREMIEPRVALRTLASLAGVGHRRRRAWIREVESLVAEMDGQGSGSGSKAFLVNLAISVSLDPSADVLLIDRLPPPAEDGLLDRCTERIRRHLDAGGAAMVAAPDPHVIEELCARAVHLEAGRVERIGPAGDIVAGLREGQRRPIDVLRPFNEDAAILSAELVDWTDRPTRVLVHGGPFRALVRFEILSPDTEVIWRVRLRGSRPSSFAEPTWQTIGAPGTFIVALELPVADWEDSEYEISVEAIVRLDGRNASIRRALPGRFGVAAATDADQGEGVFDPTQLTSDWARIDASMGETLVDP